MVAVHGISWKPDAVMQLKHTAHADQAVFLSMHSCAVHMLPQPNSTYVVGGTTSGLWLHGIEGCGGIAGQPGWASCMRCGTLGARLVSKL
jgi:hypothetical protein